MIKFSNRSNLMLKHQKAKAKLVEYGIPRESYPHFQLDSNDLIYTVVYVLSAYAESIIDNETNKCQYLSQYLKQISQYIDATINSYDQNRYEDDLLLSGIVSYFFANDLGSSKVLCAKYFNQPNVLEEIIYEPQKILSNLLKYLLLNKPIACLEKGVHNRKLIEALKKYFLTGVGEQNVKDLVFSYRTEKYKSDEPMDLYYVDLLCAVVILLFTKASWHLMPLYSGIEISKWKNYLVKANAPKMLWPTQQLIGESGVFKGESAIIQLPTGVGKTKSIELMIRSSLMSNRKTTIIVAPLRALCNEIANEMLCAFGEEVQVNQFSDILEDDFSFDALQSKKARILISTPEKLSYIFHHQPEFLSEIDLFIFDEAHMFDDGSRGVLYELLLAEVRMSISSDKQIILLSAVLPNANSIRSWLFRDQGILVSSSKIKTTQKSIGFISNDKSVHYYSDSFQAEDFFVPRSWEPVELDKKNRERKQRYFPKTDDSMDLAIFFANKLIKNGGVAIFANQTKSVTTIIQRIKELKDRNYPLPYISKNSDPLEVEKLTELIQKYYGTEHSYSLVAKVGVFPHYSYLPNGLRAAIEHSFRADRIRSVVCTSTLAQGVNIPIKYLFITGIQLGREQIKIRSFHNLLGRTARSGMFTEGSVIITKSTIYDNRKQNWKGTRDWSKYIRLFDSSAAEPCGSAILIGIRNFVESSNYSATLQKAGNFNDLPENLVERIVAEIIEAIPQNKSLKTIVESIETQLCFSYSGNSDEDIKEVAKSVCKATLAYFLGTEVERELLLCLFIRVAEKINQIEKAKVRKYSKSLVGVDLLMHIEDWIEQKQLNLRSYSNEELIDELISFYVSLPNSEYHDIFPRICDMWLNGATYYKMAEEMSLKINEVEEICSRNISYKMSFFIGNIIDMLEISDTEKINSLNQLKVLQKRFKYGVKTVTATSICEKVFNDQYLANLMSEQIVNEFVGTGEIIEVVQMNKEKLLNLLEPYPSYFSERIKYLCERDEY